MIDRALAFIVCLIGSAVVVIWTFLEWFFFLLIIGAGIALPLYMFFFTDLGTW